MHKKFILFNLITIIGAAFFTVFQISIKADLSLIAFPLSLLFVLWLSYESYIQLIKNLNIQRLSLVIKLFQYLPYVLLAAFIFRRAGSVGTSHWYDVLTVLLWVIVLIFSHASLYFLNHKRLFEKNPELKKIAEHIPSPRMTKVKKILFETLDWVDAIIQAVCTVALLNIFVFQLYQIPSESMVSEFLVRDRVVGYKLDAGPKFPLSNVGVPEIKQYDRGDIVIFSNPHYDKGRSSQLRTFLSQLVHMLTLTSVNINVDEQGVIKADPLVKRIVGVSGEQLVMQDGVLYSRTKDGDDFKPVDQDASWAVWNVASLPSNVLENVQYVPMSAGEFEIMLQIEEERKELDINEAQVEAQNLSRQFSQLTQHISSTQSQIEPDSFSDKNILQVYSFVFQSDDLIRELYYSQGGDVWFESFMTDWIDNVTNEYEKKDTYIGGDIYSDAMFRQNLLLKLNFGRLAVRTAELLSSNVSASVQNQDSERIRILQDLQSLAFYITSINDARNMSVFPPNEESGKARFLEDDNFFVMGDNRFNSLDMRHSYDSSLKKITDLDVWSLYYNSNLSPQSITIEDILGTPILRFYPLRRFGIP